MAIETNVVVEPPKRRAMIGPAMQIGVARTVIPLTVKIVERPLKSLLKRGLLILHLPLRFYRQVLLLVHELWPIATPLEQRSNQ